MGEPEGKVTPILTLDKVKERLEMLLGKEVLKTDDCIGPEVEKKVSELNSGEILLLENVRFHKEETENDSEFAKQLANLGDIYINDAFGDSHRAHASMVGIPQYLPHGAGLLLEKEIENLNKILQSPEKPLIALVGGAKVKTKGAFIEKISEAADMVLISGLIKKEFLTSSLRVERSNLQKIIGPANDLNALDIDEETIKIFREKILQAKTIVWNGPFGKFEEEPYGKGTLQIANAIIESGAFSVVGGGETIEFLNKEGMLDEFNHVSTGGGAMLNYLAGEKLPGLEALEEV